MTRSWLALACLTHTLWAEMPEIADPGSVWGYEGRLAAEYHNNLIQDGLPLPGLRAGFDWREPFLNSDTRAPVDVRYLGMSADAHLTSSFAEIKLSGFLKASRNLSFWGAFEEVLNAQAELGVDTLTRSSAEADWSSARARRDYAWTSWDGFSHRQSFTLGLALRGGTEVWGWAFRGGHGFHRRSGGTAFEALDFALDLPLRRSDETFESDLRLWKWWAASKRLTGFARFAASNVSSGFLSSGEWIDPEPSRGFVRLETGLDWSFRPALYPSSLVSLEVAWVNKSTRDLNFGSDALRMGIMYTRSWRLGSWNE